jgi:L-2-hydroxyglutarate oxidase LhgO
MLLATLRNYLLSRVEGLAGWRLISKDEGYLIECITQHSQTKSYGKSVVVAPMLDGHLLVGPTAEEDIAKENPETYYYGAISVKSR